MWVCRVNTCYVLYGLDKADFSNLHSFMVIGTVWA